MKSKIIIILLVLIVGVGGFIGYKLILAPKDNHQASTEKEKINVKKLKEQSFTMEEITTNTASGDLVQVAFGVVLEDKESKEEFETRISEFESIIIKTLASKQPADLRGTAAITSLEEGLATQFNQTLSHGKVKTLSINKFVLP